MSRLSRAMHGYQLIQPDAQLDLFACREGRVHIVARQLELGSPTDRTLCGTLLPARPRLHPLNRRALGLKTLCPACMQRLQGAKRGLPNPLQVF